jgi:hypothetical protein
LYGPQAVGNQAKVLVDRPEPLGGSKDHETNEKQAASSEAFVQMAMTCLMARRLSPSGGISGYGPAGYSWVSLAFLRRSRWQRLPYAGERIYEADAHGDARTALIVFGERILRFIRQFVVIDLWHAACHEVIVEDLAQLLLGEARRGVEGDVQIFLACREERDIEQNGLGEAQIDAKVGDREAVIRFDQLPPVWWATPPLRELDA